MTSRGEKGSEWRTFSDFINLRRKNKFIGLLFSVSLHSTVGKYCPLLAKCSDLKYVRVF